MTIVNNMMNVDMYLNRPIQWGFKAHIDILLRLANAKNFQSVFSQKTDLCATTSSVKNSLVKSWFKDMSKNGNIRYNCPVEVGHYYMHQWRMGSSMTHKFMLKVGNFATSCPIKGGYYYLHGWTLDANYVPSFLYLGDYRIGGSFFYGRFKKQSDNPLVECSVEAVLN